MKKEEIKKRVEKVKKAIEEIRESKIDYRECLILADNYDKTEAKIFRKAFNEGFRFRDKSFQDVLKKLENQWKKWVNWAGLESAGFHKEVRRFEHEFDKIKKEIK